MRIVVDSPEAKAFYGDIGEKLRKIRLHRGFSQSQLAERLNITFQQVQKYEKGSNRLPLYYLVEICKIFQAPLDYFISLQDKAMVVSHAEVELLTLIDRHIGRDNMYDFIKRLKRYSQKEHCSFSDSLIE